MKPGIRFLTTLLILSFLLSSTNVMTFAHNNIKPQLSVTVPVDVVFAIDNTGSMATVISQVKTDAQYVMDTIRANAPDSYFAAIKFMDYGDPYVTTVASNLSYDINSVKTAILGMSASGGGDWPEAYIEMVYQAVNEITWRANSIKIVVVMGDAPPHDTVYGTGSSPLGLRWSGAASEAANSGVKVSMVATGTGIGNTTVQQSYQYMANSTGGIYREAVSSTTLANDLISLIENLAVTTPIVTSTYPANGDIGISTSSDITATFNIPIDPDSLNQQTVLVSSTGSLARLGQITYDSTSRTMHFSINSFTPLYPGTLYTVTLTTGILGENTPQSSLPLTTWSFTTYGTPSDRLENALSILNQEILSTVDYNSHQAANILGTTKSRTSVNLLKLSAECIIDVVSGSVTPVGLPTTVVKTLEQFETASLIKHILDANTWLQGKLDTAPEDEEEAQVYFYNSLQNDIPIRDESPDRTVSWNGTGMVSLKADINTRFNNAIGSIPPTLTEAQAAPAIAFIEKMIVDVRKARSTEVLVSFYDEYSHTNKLYPIGTMTTQTTQFEEIIAKWDQAETISNTFTITQAVGLGVKAASSLCIGLSIGVCAPIGAPAFATSEYVVWGSNVAGGVATVIKQVVIPSEYILSQSVIANSAALQENIQIRQLALNSLSRVGSLISTLSELPNTNLLQVNETQEAAYIQVSNFHINDLYLPIDLSIGDTTGSVDIQNNATTTQSISASVLISANLSASEAAIVSITSIESIQLSPGASSTLPINISVPASRVIGANGFEAELYIQSEDSVSGKVNVSGPKIAHFNSGTDKENAEFRIQPPQTILSGYLGNGQISEEFYEVQGNSIRVRFSLSQELGSDFDLHIYDSSGHHIGYNYSTSLVETIEGATYSGRDTQRETIEVDSALGPFRVKVVAIDSMGQSTFNVNALEIPASTVYLPILMRETLTLGTSFDSQFNGSALGWTSHSGVWAVDSYYYYTQGLPDAWATSSHSGIYSNFNYQVKLWRYGCNTCANQIIIQGNPLPLGADKSWYSYYVFQYNRDGYFSVWKKVPGVAPIALQGWIFSSSIKTNENWNVLRVIAYGGNLYYFINDILVWSGTDTALSSGQVGIGMYQSSSTSGNYLYVDSAILTTITADELSELGVSPSQYPPITEPYEYDQENSYTEYEE